MSMMVSGLTSGIDWDDMVHQLMEVERRPVLLMNDRMAGLERARTAWQSINGALLALKTAAESPASGSLWSAMRVSSSDRTVATATAEAGALQGTYTLEVDSLATAQRVASDQVPDASAPLEYEGSFEIGVGAAEAVVVQLDQGDSLVDIRDAINAAGAGVSAAVIDNRLVVTADQVGEENQIHLAEVGEGTVLAELGLLDGAAFKHQLAAAADAHFSVGGLAIQRGSNTIDDVVAGVTFDLLQAGQSVISVRPDSHAMAGAVRTLVDRYNSTAGAIRDARKADGGALSGDSTLRRLESDLSRLLDGQAGSLSEADINMLMHVGVTRAADNSGNLAFSEEAFSAAWEQDPAAVAQLFTAEDSPVALLADRLDYITRDRGLIDGLDGSFELRIQHTARQIERMELRLEKRQDTLLRQFRALESVLATMQTQSAWLDQQLNAASAGWRQNRPS